MVNYTKLADEDVGGTLDAAFATMSAAGTTVTTQEHLMSYLSIANQVDFATSMALEAVVKAAVIGATLPTWVDTILNTTGIDVNNPQTAALVNSLVAGTFTQVMADAIIATGGALELTYPGLQPGHLQNAREKRLAGDI